MGRGDAPRDRHPTLKRQASLHCRTRGADQLAPEGGLGGQESLELCRPAC